MTAIDPARNAETGRQLPGDPEKHLIGGKWVDARSGRTFPAYNPGDGLVIAQVAELSRRCRQEFRP